MIRPIPWWWERIAALLTTNRELTLAISSKGSMPVSWKDENMKFEFYGDSLTYDKGLELETKVDAFLKIDSTCRARGIKLILVHPPNFSNINQAFRDRMTELSGESTGELTYNRENPVYREKYYWFDDGHLTREGAEIYTAELAEQLNALE